MSTWAQTPAWQKAVLGLMGLVLLGKGLVAASKPLLEHKRELALELSTAEAELNVMRAEAGAYDAQSNELARLQQELAEAMAALPDRRQTLGLMRQLVAPALNAGAELLSFEPGEELETKEGELPAGVRRFPVRIRLRADFVLLVQWLALLRDLPRLAVLSRLEVQPDARVPQRLQVDIEVTAFVTERAQAAGSAPALAAVQGVATAATLPPVEVPAVRFASERPAAAQAALEKLDARILGFMGGRAMISGGSAVGIGDTIKGWTVVGIDPGAATVTVEKGGARQVLGAGG